jgi:hypothetical protein
MKKIIGIFICMLLLTIIFPISVNAGNQKNPEIVDDIGDTPLSLLDIESAWFYELEEEPNFLFTAMKILFLKENYNAVFTIRWSFDGIEYAAGLNTFTFRDTIFRCGLPKQATYWQWNNMPKCNGILDFQEGIITWKIPKSSIGNPQQGDILTNTKATAVPGFPISFLYFLLQFDYRDFAPDDHGEYGQDYQIKY